MGAYHESFKQDGFVLVEGGITDHVLEDLRTAVTPLIENRGDTLRYQTILEPTYFHHAFIDFLNLPNLAEVVTDVLQTDPSFAGLALLLGANKNTICNWHRDFGDTHPDVPELTKNHATQFIQYNCAIYDDTSLWVVPGSHARLSHDQELAYAQYSNKEETFNRQNVDDATMHEVISNMPGAVNVQLNAGDCLLYNPVIWHSAIYKPEWKRATLHGAWKDPQIVDKFESQRWGIDHNPWFEDPGYMGELGDFFGPSLEKFRAFMEVYT